MEIEQHATKQWMGQKWDQGRNQKVSGNKWKWTHNNPKPMGHSSPEREVYSDTSLPKKIETFQMNNLTLRIQELEEQERQPRTSRRK